LAGVLKWAARFEEAEALYEDVFRARRSTLGEAHPDTYIVRYNLALMPLARANSIKCAIARTVLLLRARRMMLDLKPDAERDLAEGDQTRLWIDVELAGIANRLGQTEEAERIYGAILPRMRRQLGRTHWRTVEAVGSAAALYREASQPATAEQLYEEAFWGYLAAKGAEDRDTFTVAKRLAEVRVKLGNASGACNVLNLLKTERERDDADSTEIEEVVKVIQELCEMSDPKPTSKSEPSELMDPGLSMTARATLD
jgi:hypothetical protein